MTPRKPFSNAVLHWDDAPQPAIGAGISRAKDGERTREYTLMVWFDKTKPMRVVLFAPTGRKAVEYAKNRWPSAVSVDLIK